MRSIRSLPFAILALLALPAGQDVLAQRPALTADSVPAYTISAMDGSDRSEIGRVAGAAFRSADELILADATTSVLSAFDRHGRWIASIGRIGSGPGEFSNIEWIGACLPDDGILVFELMSRRFTVLDRQLRYSRSFRLAGSPTSLACARNGTLAYLSVLRDSQPTQRASWRGSAELHAADVGGGSSRVIGTHPVGDLVRVGATWMPMPGGRRTTVAVTDDRIHVGTGGREPIVAVDRRGNALAHLQLTPLASNRHGEATTEASADDFLSRIADRSLRDAFRKQLLDAPRIAVDVQYRRVIADPSGVLWFQRSLRGASATELTATDARGRELARISFPVDGDLLAVGSERLALVTVGEEGAETVLVYTIRRQPALAR